MVVLVRVLVLVLVLVLVVPALVVDGSRGNSKCKLSMRLAVSGPGFPVRCN